MSTTFNVAPFVASNIVIQNFGGNIILSPQSNGKPLSQAKMTQDENNPHSLMNRQLGTSMIFWAQPINQRHTNIVMSGNSVQGDFVFIGTEQTINGSTVTDLPTKDESVLEIFNAYGTNISITDPQNLIFIWAITGNVTISAKKSVEVYIGGTHLQLSFTEQGVEIIHIIGTKLETTVRLREVDQLPCVIVCCDEDKPTPSLVIVQ